MQPALKRGETSTCPVVYATDANWTFDALKGISYSIRHLGRDAPRFILVGIGYPGECPEAGAMLRGRDMSFPGYPQFSMEPPAMEDVLLAEEGTKDFYGAEDFQRFIEHELVPFIDGRYQTIPGERTYFGHSLGGGFGLYTLFTRPGLFRNYIISSPGLSYDGETSAGIEYSHYDFVLEDARKFIESRPSIGRTRVYMSVGTEEEYEIDYTPWQLTSSAYRLASLMKAAAVPGLEFMFEVFRAEMHMTVWPMAFIHGVQAVFGTGMWAERTVRASAN